MPFCQDLRCLVMVSLAAVVVCCDGRPVPSRIGKTYPTGEAGETGTAPECAEPAADRADVSLAEVFQSHFKLGVALGPSAFIANELDPSALEEQQAFVKHQFNRISPENVLKWSHLQPSEGTFRFELADAFVDFGAERGLEIHGHVLVWHQQTPPWVFTGRSGSQATREELLGRLEAHMAAVAERYASRIAYWDVVNEALTDEGTLRDSPWRSVLGDDYIGLAFEMAARYFPDAKLVYNDYSLFLPAKREASIELVTSLRRAGLKVDAIGMQGHYNLSRPTTSELESTLAAYERAGIEVLVTELDLDVLPRDTLGADLDDEGELSEAADPYRECLPANVDDQIAAKWASIFGAFVRYSDTISSVTFWGIHDGLSWLNNWPIEGRTNHPLLFDRDLRPKAAFEKVIQQAEGS